MSKRPSQITWIDPDSLTALAREAGLARKPERRGPERIGIGLLRAAGSPPRGGGLLGGHFAPPPAGEKEEPLPYPVFTPPELPLKHRVNALMDWLFRNAGASTAFLADGDGLPLAQRGASVDLIGISAVFADAAHQLARSLKADAAGAVHVDLDGGSTFHLIGLENGPQNLALGFVSRLSVDASCLSQIADSVLAAVAERPGEKSSSFY